MLRVNRSPLGKIVFRQELIVLVVFQNHRCLDRFPEGVPIEDCLRFRLWLQMEMNKDQNEFINVPLKIALIKIMTDEGFE